MRFLRLPLEPLMVGSLLTVLVVGLPLTPPVLDLVASPLEVKSRCPRPMAAALSWIPSLLEVVGT